MSILTVGVGKQYSTIASAVAASHDGDVVQIQAGTYTNDFATIFTKITLDGVGGMAHLVATVAPPNGKGILVTDTDVTIDHLEISGAQVPDGNGAGIRYEAGNLTITNSYFHDNQNGILGAADPSGNISISNSEFGHNGSGTGYTHGIYIGDVASLTVDNSYFHDTQVGHEIKSRAENTTITNSRIQNGPTGTASYEIDLPNGGNTVIQNNVIQKGPYAQNRIMVSFGEEGGLYANSALNVSGNTMLNDAGAYTTGVWNGYLPTATISGNQVYGLTASQMLAGYGTVSGTTTLATEPALNSASPIAITTNHAATISGDTAGAVTEDAAVNTASGQLTVADVDTGENHFQTPASLAGSYGTFSFDPATGKWGYALDNSRTAVQALAAGQTAADTLNVKSFDGTATQAITVTVTGTNDAATITGNRAGAVTEDAAVNTASGQLTVADVDTGENHFQTPASLAGSYGTFSFDPATGKWGYALDNSRTAVQALAAGQTAADTLNVKSFDGTATQAITVTVTGTNDAATITGNTAGAVTKDAAVNTASGQLTVADVDTGENHFQTPASLAGSYGTFSFDPATGKWGYALDNSRTAVQALAAGQTAADTLNVKSFDGTATQAITVTVTGAAATPPPPPPTTGTLTLNVSEDAYLGDAYMAVQVDGLSKTFYPVTASHAAGQTQDVTITGIAESGAAHTVTVSFLNDLYGGSASLDRNLYLNSSQYDGQAVAGGSAVFLRNTSVSFVASAPSTPIAITTNHAATITGDTAGAVTEDAAVNTASGQLTVADVDTGENHFQTPASLAGSYGTFSFDPATGKWGYALDNSRTAVQALAAGQTAADTLNVKSFDGTATQAITVTVTGTNDAATITGNTAGAVTEDAAVNTASGQLTVADVDTGENHFQTPASLAGSYGTFSFDPATGKWGYALDNSRTAVQALAAGQTAADTLNVKSFDGTATQAITVTVTGTNDAATITGNTAGAVTKGAAVNTASGQLTVADVDTGENHFQTPASLAGSYGTFSFDPATGKWGYALDNSRTAVQALAAGQTAADTLNVKSFDGTATQAITVTVTGTAATPPPPTPTTGTLTLNVSEDAYLGDALMGVQVDGLSKTFYPVTASHAAGQTQDVTITGIAESGAAHTVTVSFLNDLYGGSASLDRNLYLNSSQYDGQAVAGGSAVFLRNTSVSFVASAPSTTAPATTAPTSHMTLNVSEDAYLGDAKMEVQVDGTSMGVYAVAASHAAGQSQAITISGILETFSPHEIAISFLNDAYGGTASLDRNLYLDSMQFDNQNVPGASAAFYTSSTDLFHAAAPASWVGP